MEKQEYEECKKRNEKLIQLFETHGLPYYNAFAFADAFCKRKNELRKSPDFLILLATLWSPNNHLFARPVDVEKYPSIELPMLSTLHSTNLFLQRHVKFLLGGNSLTNALDYFKLYQMLAPRNFAAYCNEESNFLRFISDMSQHSYLFNLRFLSNVELLVLQRQSIAEYKQWESNYVSHKRIKSEIKAFLEENSSKDISLEMIIRLLEIAQEYIKNLRTDSKNNSKYKPIYERISKYIKAAKNDNICTEDNLDMDDPIGSIFERMLKISIYFDPLNRIGPMYLCWMIENRLIKFSKYDADSFNYSLDTNPEKTFPYKNSWHNGGRTVSDVAHVYLFDTLCAWWKNEKINFSMPLSVFLFERTLPCYSDFLLVGNNPLTDPKITHQLVTYSDLRFSSSYLPTCLSATADMLCINPDWFPLPFPVQDENWDICNTGTIGNERDIVKNASYDCSKRMIQSLNANKNLLKKYKIDEKSFLRSFIACFSQKPYYEEFIKLIFLNPFGYHGTYRISYKDQIALQQSLTQWVIACIDLIEPDQLIRVQDDLDDTAYRDICYILQDYVVELGLNAVPILYSGYFRDELWSSLILLCKEMFFYEDFTDEQYQRLQDFGEEFCQCV